MTAPANVRDTAEESGCAHEHRSAFVPDYIAELPFVHVRVVMSRRGPTLAIRSARRGSRSIAHPEYRLAHWIITHTRHDLIIATQIPISQGV